MNIESLDVNTVKLLYEIEHKSQNETAKILGCCTITLQKFLKQHNIKTHRNYKRSRKYTFDENYFENIDTKDKAYFLGLFYSDGNINKTLNTCSINLVEKDKHILDRFVQHLNFTGKLRFIDLNHKGWSNQFNLTINSQIFIKHLLNKHCVPNKSLILKFPTTEIVRTEFLPHFIRGYFDGDGCICIPKSRTSPILTITSTESFCFNLQSYLKTLNIISYVRKHSKMSNCYVLYMQKKDDIYNFYKYIYNNAEELYLNRKKHIFDKLFETD